MGLVYFKEGLLQRGLEYFRRQGLRSTSERGVGVLQRGGFWSTSERWFRVPLGKHAVIHLKQG